MLNAIRGFLFYVAFSIILIPFAITLWMLKPFKRDWRFAYARKWANLMLWLGRVICGMRWEEKGMENLPDSSQPVVVLAKHQSAWETFWMFARLPNYISYVYKKELHWVPVFGWALASMEMMAINRAEGRHAFVNSCAKVRNSWMTVGGSSFSRKVPVRRRVVNPTTRRGALVLPFPRGFRWCRLL